MRGLRVPEGPWGSMGHLCGAQGPPHGTPETHAFTCFGSPRGQNLCFCMVLCKSWGGPHAARKGGPRSGESRAAGVGEMPRGKHWENQFKTDAFKRFRTNRGGGPRRPDRGASDSGESRAAGVGEMPWGKHWEKPTRPKPMLLHGFVQIVGGTPRRPDGGAPQR